MRLNLGAGEVPLEGYENLDAKTGQEIYPLAIEDDSCDEVRASHCLEHFPHGQVLEVVKEWVRVLKPGGVLKVAVPDFQVISQQYLAGANLPLQGYVMGGQVDDLDYHKAIFDYEALTDVLRAAGLSRIERWESETKDCAALPISLNLQGVKQELKPLNVGAVMSVPRLGFMDNVFCAFGSLMPLKIPIRKHTGAFWGQCMERAIQEAIEEGHDYILTIDYDSVYTKWHVETLIRLAQEYPDVDAIAPIQHSRSKAFPLFTVHGDDGRAVPQLHRDVLMQDLMPAATAHFGLTLIKVSALLDMPHPWFWSKPGKEGTWGEDREDDDIYFWKRWQEAGKSLCIANRVPIGHAELQITWPDVNLEPTMQHPSDFWDGGPPENVWT